MRKKAAVRTKARCFNTLDLSLRGKAALDAGTRSTHATAESSKANYRRWTKQGWVYPNRDPPSAAPEASREASGEAEGEAAAPARRERCAPKPERLVPRASARGDLCTRRYAGLCRGHEGMYT